MTPFDYADGPRLIPVDRQAEEDLAGLAVVDGGVAVRLVDEMMATDFHDRRCWQIIEAAAATPPLTDGDKEWADAQRLGHGLVVHGCAARADAIANSTGIQWSWLAQLVERRSAENMDRLAERVVVTAQRRRVNQDLVDQLEVNDVDVRWLTDVDAIVDDARTAIVAVADAIGRFLYGDGTEAAVGDTVFSLGQMFAVDEDALREAFTRDARRQEDDDGDNVR